MRALQPDSISRCERQSSFSNSFCGKEERFADILRLQVGIKGEDFLQRLAFRNEGDDRRNWNAESPKARNAVHLAWIRRDAHERHTAPL